MNSNDFVDSNINNSWCPQVSIFTFEKTKVRLDFEKYDYMFGFSSSRCCCYGDIGHKEGEEDNGFEWEVFLD